VAKVPFQSLGDLDFGQDSGHFSVPRGPNVKGAKLLYILNGRFRGSSDSLASPKGIVAFTVCVIHKRASTQNKGSGEAQPEPFAMTRRIQGDG
jgi:hypothetical protein